VLSVAALLRGDYVGIYIRTAWGLYLFWRAEYWTAIHDRFFLTSSSASEDAAPVDHGLDYLVMGALALVLLVVFVILVVGVPPLVSTGPAYALTVAII
jgi:hypothetical protein